MKGNKVAPAKKRSVLAFFLGLLLGIIIILSSLLGVTIFALTYDLDTVLSMAGLDNGSDETGHTYVNTNVEDGGVQNLMQLMSVVYGWSQNYGDLTIGQIDALVPATRGIVNQVKATAEKYTEVDEAELKSTKFSAFGEYMKNLIMNVRTASVIDEFGMYDTMNKMLKIILYGIEANYVYAPSGEIYPLYVDNFRFDEPTGQYVRVEDNQPLDPAQYGYLVQETSNKDVYDLFFYVYDYPGAENVHFIAERNPDDVTEFFFTATPEQYSSHMYDYMYSEESAETTGNYYYDNLGEQVFIEPVTLGSLVSGEGMGVLDKVLVIELIDEETSSEPENPEEPENPGEENPENPENPEESTSGNKPDLLRELMGDVTVGDLMYGRVDFNERVNSLKLESVMKIDPRGNAVMAYIGYGLLDMSEEPDEEGRYTATYKTLDGESYSVYVKMDGASVVSITAADGSQTFEGTLIGEVSSRVDGVTRDIKIGSLMKIDESNTIMNAIRNSTVESLPGDVANLTVNELYAEEIYGYDQTVTDGEGNTTTQRVNAKRRLAVPADTEEISEEQIAFDKAYLYYELDESGVFKLVNIANDGEEGGPGKTDNGKLTEEQFAAGIAEGRQFYTYGAPNKLWKLLVYERITETRPVIGEGGAPQVDEDGNPITEEVFLYSTECAYSVNSITDMVGNVTENIRDTSLADLSEAGILKFKAEDLAILISGGETPEDPSDDVTLGDLPLERALSELITLLRLTHPAQP